MSKETVYHGRQDDVQSVHSMYEVTERDRKLKSGWKVLVGGLCTLAMLLECTNVVLSSLLLVVSLHFSHPLFDTFLCRFIVMYQIYI